MLRFISFGSGSSGNCYFLYTDTDGLLIDIGVGIRTLKKEFKDYDYEDDAARQALGGSWRMPTEAEWTELLNNCTWTWVENYNGSGINGQLVTSKTNSNSIFLPAGGGLGATFFDNGGSKGYFWSSSIDTGYPYSAWGMRFCYGNTFARCYGLSVRPVSE